MPIKSSLQIALLQFCFFNHPDDLQKDLLPLPLTHFVIYDTDIVVSFDLLNTKLILLSLSLSLSFFFNFHVHYHLLCLIQCGFLVFVVVVNFVLDITSLSQSSSSSSSTTPMPILNNDNNNIMTLAQSKCYSIHATIIRCHCERTDLRGHIFSLHGNSAWLWYACGGRQDWSRWPTICLYCVDSTRRTS